MAARKVDDERYLGCVAFGVEPMCASIFFLPPRAAAALGGKRLFKMVCHPTVDLGVHSCRAVRWDGSGREGGERGGRFRLASLSFLVFLLFGSFLLVSLSLSLSPPSLVVAAAQPDADDGMVGDSMRRCPPPRPT